MSLTTYTQRLATDSNKRSHSQLVVTWMRRDRSFYKSESGE
ncbi:MAG: hypothetical protein AB1589_27980 [Cyanobacteriota bacterium]